MARRAFYSFHYVPDHWRASQVRNMGVIEGNAPVKDNDWESITRGGDAAITKWIDEQMSGKSCVIVLIGSNTANRKWINHEISKAWNENKGVLGIYIHRLKNADQEQVSQGNNPFDYITFQGSGKKLSTVAKTYNPPYSDSTQVYAHIKSNLADWIETAIDIRNTN
jgi:antiphage defense system Thoeris ThsB-like protein